MNCIKTVLFALAVSKVGTVFDPKVRLVDETARARADAGGIGTFVPEMNAL